MDTCGLKKDETGNSAVKKQMSLKLHPSLLPLPVASPVSDMAGGARGGGGGHLPLQHPTGAEV